MNGVVSISARMAEISGRLALLAPPVRRGGAPEVSPGAAFASVLSEVTDATGAAAALPGPLPGGSPGADTGERAVAGARRLLGVPYLWGGTDPTRGLDCSGLMKAVYGDLGITLPRVSSDQARAGVPVAGLAQARPGDLLFFDNSSRRAGIDHVAIYVGNGRMVEAPRAGLAVREVAVPGTPVAIRRVTGDGTPPPRAAGVPWAPGPSGSAGSSGSYDAAFRAAETANGLPTGLLAAVARVESGLRPDAVSPAGARGLMQFMPGTAREMGIDPMDTQQAIEGAGRLLASHLRTFGSLDLALAAYNAGPGAVRRYGGVPPYTETQQYVTKVRRLLGGDR